MFNFLKKTQEALKRSREGFLGKVFGLFEQRKVDESLWKELEELLLLADVGVKTTKELLNSMQERVKKESVNGTEVKSILKQEMVRLLSQTRPEEKSGNGTTAAKQETLAGTGDNDRSKNDRSKTESKPKIVLMVGVNGSGKTTSVAKLANSYKSQGKSVLIAAADTFRAAAIEQLEEWGKRTSIDVIHHQAGGDPGAVVFDAARAAISRNIDIVLIDTAGRLHTKYNLMEELKKIKRVISKAAPQANQEVLLVLDATTGQNGLAQARTFTEAVQVNGILLAKLDGTAKGGIVLAVSQELRIPIKYIGTGEGLEDLAPFDAEAFVEALCAA